MTTIVNAGAASATASAGGHAVVIGQSSAVRTATSAHHHANARSSVIAPAPHTEPIVRFTATPLGAGIRYFAFVDPAGNHLVCERAVGMEPSVVGQLRIQNMEGITGQVFRSGKTYSREDLLDSARSKEIVYERQDEDPGTQTVRVWGDTAVVTARLWLKGTSEGTAFERRLWFSDTYVRTPHGWRYVFGQASLPLPSEASATAER